MTLMILLYGCFKKAPPAVQEAIVDSLALAQTDHPTLFDRKQRLEQQDPSALEHQRLLWLSWIHTQRL